MAAAALSFGAADTLGGSGFLAVYLVGLAVGSTPSRYRRQLAAFHEGDTYMPLDPEGVRDRLARSGFTEVDVRVNEFGWAARARAQ